MAPVPLIRLRVAVIAPQKPSCVCLSWSSPQPTHHNTENNTRGCA
uniref:Uncharacterized protein n=1 Tax=Human herpesvirus 1 TaxID=10298 RepID=A0A2Z4H1H8_HHV1|nr:hypothetical protein [Human alphaherpesvirus 1]